MALVRFFSCPVDLSLTSCMSTMCLFDISNICPKGIGNNWSLLYTVFQSSEVQ